MRFLKSPARRSVLRVTGALIALLLVAAGSSAYTVAARAEPGHKVSGHAASGKPPAGLQLAADQMVAGLADTATGQPMRAQDRVHIGSITKTFVALEHQLRPARDDHPEGDRAEPDHRDQP